MLSSFHLSVLKEAIHFFSRETAPHPIFHAFYIYLSINHIKEKRRFDILCFLLLQKGTGGCKLKVGQISPPEECGVPLGLTFAVSVPVEYGGSPEGQRPGTGAVNCHLSKPPVAESRIGNQIWPLAEGTGERPSAAADIPAQQGQRGGGKTSVTPERGLGDAGHSPRQHPPPGRRSQRPKASTISCTWASSYLSLGILFTTVNITCHLSFSEKLYENTSAL